MLPFTAVLLPLISTIDGQREVRQAAALQKKTHTHMLGFLLLVPLTAFPSLLFLVA